MLKKKNAHLSRNADFRRLLGSCSASDVNVIRYILFNFIRLVNKQNKTKNKKQKTKQNNKQNKTKTKIFQT